MNHLTLWALVFGLLAGVANRAAGVETVPPGGGNRLCTPEDFVQYCCDDGSALECRGTLNGPQVDCPSGPPGGGSWSQEQLDDACAPGDPEVMLGECAPEALDPITMIYSPEFCLPVPALPPAMLGALGFALLASACWMSTRTRAARRAG